MNIQQTEADETPHFLEVLRSRTELQKILWITGVWVFFSIFQSLYDRMVLLSSDVDISGQLFWTNLLVNALATMLAGLIGGTILVTYLQRWIRNNPYGQAILFILLAFTLIICFVTILAFITRTTISGEEELHRQNFFLPLACISAAWGLPKIISCGCS